jgi:4-alpha-glucanotransferase
MKEQNYSWWVERIKKSSELFDIVRIDHFRGFAGYFTIPFGDTTARNGSWMVGPGYDLFRVINEELPGTKIIAENLGFLDQSVTDLLDACGYPGMCIMQFDFGNGYDYSPLKEGLAENNVIYTGTHDNQTILSWYYDSNDHLKWCIREHFGINEGDAIHLKIIEGTLKETPYIAIIPFQDYLGLVDWQGRMNIPSTLGCNWRWRSLRTHYNASLAKYIRKITEESNRL